MSFIFQSPQTVWSFSIPLWVHIDTPMDWRLIPFRGVGETDITSLQYVQLRNRENHSHRTRPCAFQSRLTRITPGDTLAVRRVVPPAFLVGKVSFISWSNPYNFGILHLSRSLGSLDLDGRQPRDSDGSAGQNTSRERNSHHADVINDGTSCPSNRDLPPSANTRSGRQQGSEGRGTPPREDRAEGRSFNSYGPRKSTLEINSAIKDLLLRRHVDTDEGYVYGFQHPDDVALDPSSSLEGNERNPHLIKIGRSKNHVARMRQISKKCGYIPHTVLVYHMPRHGMVERVVHAQLHNSRLRDVGCTGCGTRHEEWFRVDVRHAERTVELWKAFVERHPYGEQGAMLPAWHERLEHLDLGDADCWQRFVHGSSLARLASDSPQELEAETAYTGFAAAHIGPSSDGDLGGDEQQEDWEVV